MRIQILGVGNAFSPDLGNSAIIIWDSSNGFLIDCGYTVFPILKEKGLLKNINKLYLTHLHGDHVGSLDTMLYYKRFVLKQKIKFYGVKEHLDYLKLIDERFDSEFSDFFQEDEEGISTLPVNHLGLKCEAFYNYGILYSGDTSDSILDTSQARDAKIILHDVSFIENNAHAYFNDLARAADDIKKKTWLYHYGSGDFDKFEEKVSKFGFAGMLKKDQSIKV